MAFSTAIGCKWETNARKKLEAMIKLFLVCPGLGNVNRGYESFTRECFDALATHPDLKTSLWKGGGKSAPKEVVLWNLPREGRAAQWLGGVTRRGRDFVDQVTFGLSLLPRISRLKPDVIYFSDGNLGNILWQWRRLTRGNYKLLFSNGGPIAPPFARWDTVQQVAPTHFQNALNAGESAEKQSVVPYGIRMEREFRPLSPEERQRVRESLELPADRPIVLCVAAINKSQKRMDYLVEEVAALPQPRPFLLLLGQQDAETPEILQLAQEKLGEGNFALKTVPSSAIGDYYRVSDMFVLASLSEGLPRSLLEGASYGLSCLAHDYELTRYALGDYGYFADFTQQGQLMTLLQNLLEHPEEESSRGRRHHDIYNRFSWDVLRSQYVAMIQKCRSL